MREYYIGISRSHRAHGGYTLCGLGAFVRDSYLFCVMGGCRYEIYDEKGVSNHWKVAAESFQSLEV